MSSYLVTIPAVYLPDKIRKLFSGDIRKEYKSLYRGILLSTYAALCIFANVLFSRIGTNIKLYNVTINNATAPTLYNHLFPGSDKAMIFSSRETRKASNKNKSSNPLSVSNDVCVWSKCKIKTKGTTRK